MTPDLTNYRKLGVAIGINTVVMFLLTYALIDRFDHFLPNINRFYMAVMMSAPMVVVMLAVMWSMYPNRKLNLALIGGFSLLFVTVFTMGRLQTGVGNDQFLRSMIPHHSSAIVMCEEAAITDSGILALCEEIVETQEREIAEMNELLAR
ncbi:MAG: DUF305 domain-containing protein [Acidimicrobiia bacterium]